MNVDKIVAADSATSSIKQRIQNDSNKNLKRVLSGIEDWSWYFGAGGFWKTNICHYCGIKLTKDTRTRDHVIPRKHLKTIEVEARQTSVIIECCRQCNGRKSCLTLLQFLLKENKHRKQRIVNKVYEWQKINYAIYKNETVKVLDVYPKLFNKVYFNVAVKIFHNDKEKEVSVKNLTPIDNITLLCNDSDKQRI